MSGHKKTLAVDFDGVISDYRGYKGKGVFARPIDGVKDFFEKLKKEGWQIIVFTTRSETYMIEEYLNNYKIPYDFINHNPANVELHLSPTKVIADVYLDDRAVTFKGRWDIDLFKEIAGFKPHYMVGDDEK